MYTVISPLRINANGNRIFLLNLNAYRNAHHYILNAAKVNYKTLLKDQISTLPTFNRITLTYTVFNQSKRKSDVGNMCTVVDKFFSDALVELGKLPDDNYEFIPEIIFRYGGVDKANPRIEITIKELP